MGSLMKFICWFFNYDPILTFKMVQKTYYYTNCMLLMSNTCTAVDGERKQSYGYIFHILFHVKNSLFAGRKHKLMRMTLILFMITTIQKCWDPGNGKSKLKCVIKKWINNMKTKYTYNIKQTICVRKKKISSLKVVGQ